MWKATCGKVTGHDETFSIVHAIYCNKPAVVATTGDSRAIARGTVDSILEVGTAYCAEHAHLATEPVYPIGDSIKVQ